MMRVILGGLVAWLLWLSPAVAVELKPFVRGSLQQIAAQHTGQPYIVAFWSVDCHYCSGELTLLREQLARHPGVALVLVSTDTRDAALRIADRLTTLALTGVESWVFADSHVERLRFEIDRNWYGELPRSYFYAPGEPVWPVSGEPEIAELEAWLSRQAHR